MNGIGPGRFNLNNLGFEPECEHSGMAQPIHCFEVIFIHCIVLRHMAIVAMGNLAVRTVAPGGILRRHNMTIYAGLRIIGQVRMCLRQVNGIKGKSGKNP
jgi:hypothetical protein